jgi:hypothetical protein
VIKNSELLCNFGCSLNIIRKYLYSKYNKDIFDWNGTFNRSMNYDDLVFEEKQDFRNYLKTLIDEDDKFVVISKNSENEDSFVSEIKDLLFKQFVSDTYYLKIYLDT